MDLVQQLGAALGLGLLSGIRLYLTVLMLGAMVRLHWLPLPDSFAGLHVFADWRVMAFAATGCVIEFVADKIPWVDSAWDSLHTIIRPVGALLVGASAFSSADPAIRTILVLLCGGVALTGHSAKSATRLALNQSPEPFSNIALSVAGDLMVPFATWFTFRYPLVTAAVVSVFVITAWWFAPRIYRSMKVELTGVASALRRFFGSKSGNGSRRPELPVELALIAPPQLSAHMQPLPATVVELLRRRGITSVTHGIRCAAGESVPGLRDSIGYLVFPADGADTIVFVTERWFRTRLLEMHLRDVSSVRWKSRWIADLFYFAYQGRVREFEVFRVAAGSPSTMPAAGSAASPAAL